jgi:DMSO reductase family type II enzyme heme b subunit
VRVKRVEATNEELLQADGSSWARLDAHQIDLTPTPIPVTAGVSVYLALSKGHGKVQRIFARMAHNGETLSLHLSWEDPQKDDRIMDLDRFVDAAAVLFPLVADTSPLTMGDETKPVNAWLWKADREEPFDVIARGFSTSQRRPASSSGLVARSLYSDGKWVVVFQRPLHPKSGEFIHFEPGSSASIAFAVWEGSNSERSGQKATSGVFVDLELDR